MVGAGSGETRTESCEVIAKEEVAAMVFCGKLSLNGWLPRLGTLMRIVEGFGRCGAAAIVEVSLYGSRLFGARLIGLTALGGRTSLELGGGDTFRTTGPIAPLCSELTSGFAEGLDSVVGDKTESVERASTESETRVLSSNFSSEGVVSSVLLAPSESSELAAGGGGVREVDSSAGSGSAGGLASVASSDLGASR